MSSGVGGAWAAARGAGAGQEHGLWGRDRAAVERREAPAGGRGPGGGACGQGPGTGGLGARAGRFGVWPARPPVSGGPAAAPRLVSPLIGEVCL